MHISAHRVSRFPAQRPRFGIARSYRLLGLIERHCANLRKMGANPAIIVDKMRPHTQHIWQHFSRDDRKDSLDDMPLVGTCSATASRPRSIRKLPPRSSPANCTFMPRVSNGVEADEGKVRVHLNSGKTLTGELVINATGPHTKFSATSSVLLGNLLRSGLLAPDDMDMGVASPPIIPSSIAAANDQRHCLRWDHCCGERCGKQSRCRNCAAKPDAWRNRYSINRILRKASNNS